MSKLEDVKEGIKRHPFLRGVLLVVWVGLCLTVAQFLAGLVVQLLLVLGWISEYDLAQPVAQFLASAVMYLVSFALMWGVPKLVLGIGTSRDELGLRGMPTWTDILLYLVGFAGTLFLGGILVGILALLLPKVDWSQEQEVGFTALNGGAQLLEAFLTLVIIAPITEELIFRGWLYGKMRLRLGAPGAILLTSFLFGVMHGQMNVGAVTFVMSVLACLQRELTGTIFSSILTHMLKNGVAFCILFL